MTVEPYAGYTLRSTLGWWRSLNRQAKAHYTSV